MLQGWISGCSFIVCTLLNLFVGYQQDLHLPPSSWHQHSHTVRAVISIKTRFHSVFSTLGSGRWDKVPSYLLFKYFICEGQPIRGVGGAKAASLSTYFTVQDYRMDCLLMTWWLSLSFSCIIYIILCTSSARDRLSSPHPSPPLPTPLHCDFWASSARIISSAAEHHFTAAAVLPHCSRVLYPHWWVFLLADWSVWSVSHRWDWGWEKGNPGFSVRLLLLWLFSLLYESTWFSFIE